MPFQVKLAEGPFQGRTIRLSEAPKGEIGLHIDEYGRPWHDSPFGLACYQADPKKPDVYSFHHYEPITAKPLPLVFADGPAKGRQADIPSERLNPVARVPLLDESTVYESVGTPTAAAIYDLRPQDGKWQYFLRQIDTTAEMVKTMVEQANEHRAIEAANSFYSTPDYDIYSITPTGDHTQVFIEVGHRRGHVDEGIAGVISRIWTLGLDTLGSCQARPKTADHPERGYLGFVIQRHARQFERILLDAGIDCTYKPKTMKIANKNSQGVVAETIEIESANVMFATTDIPKVEAALDEWAAKQTK